MKYSFGYFLAGLAIGATLCGGCATPQTADHRSADPSLPQLVRFFSINQLRLKPGILFISGKGSAAANGGKNTLTAPSPFSSYPFIEITIKSENPGELEACMKNVQDMKESHKSFDIRGAGTYTVESVIDPPKDTGVFTLTKLEACGTRIASTPAAIPVVSTGTVPAADLVAVPERYLDQRTVISGRISSPVHFMDPVSRLTIESEGQSLSGYFLTTSLAAESRLSLVHAAPGSILVVEGTLTRIKNMPGYEFDISRVVSIEPAK